VVKCGRKVNLEKYLSFTIEKWFGGVNKRPFTTYAIHRIDEKWDDKSIFLVEAPTGYGKSTISASVALYSLKEELKALVVFPLRTLLEDQYDKFLRLTDKVFLGKRYMHNPDSPYLIKPITLTTIDTLSLVLFGIAPEDLQKVMGYYTGTWKNSLGHYLFSWASVAMSNIILDEVHLLSDTTKSLSFLAALLKIVEENDQRLVLMSATIPEALKKSLSEESGEIEIISFNESLDEYFVAERRKKRYDVLLEPLKTDEKLYKILQWIEEEYKEFHKILVVFNTVKDAIEFYRLLAKKAPSIKKGKLILLLHSRFSERDRVNKVNKLKEIKNSEEYIIVSTQVVEAGVDISSNLFITELAPANSLIQRLGRFLRYEGEDKGKVYIWYEVDENGKLLCSHGMYKVYDYNLTNRTLEVMEEKEKISFHLPSSYSELLNKTYTVEDFKIDQNGVDDLRRILQNFDLGSLVALERFFELEGSFIREGYIASVVTEDLVEEFREEGHLKIKPKEFSLLVIPISSNILLKLKPEKEIVLTDGKIEIWETSFKQWLGDKKRVKISNLVRYMVRNNVLAFMIPGSYSDEEGLIVGDHG